MKRSTLSIVAATMILAVLLGWWLLDTQGRPAAGTEIPGAVTAAADAATRPAIPKASSTTAVVTPAKSDGGCRGGRLVLTGKDGVKHEDCADAVGASQNGNVRRYRFTAQRDRDLFLQIETQAGIIVRIEAGHGGGAEHGCDGPACKGASFGRPDFNGVQAIRLSSTVLSREAVADDAKSDGPLTIDADLSALGNVAPICDDGVTLNFSDNSYTRFCALGGNGFSRGEGNVLRYSFRDLDGGAIVVGTDPAGTIRQIELAPENLRCTGEDCVGAAFTPPDAGGNRILTFTGTRLQSQDGQRSVMLNGKLILTGESS